MGALKSLSIYSASKCGFDSCPKKSGHFGKVPVLRKIENITFMYYATLIYIDKNNSRMARLGCFTETE